MRTSKIATDPLWQALCPSWTQAIAPRTSCAHPMRRRPALQCLSKSHGPCNQQRCASSVGPSFADDLPTVQDRPSTHDRAAPRHQIGDQEGPVNFRFQAPREDGPIHARSKAQQLHHRRQQEQQFFYQQASTPRLYTKLKALAYSGHVEECRKLVEWLVRERREKPNSQLYSALILSNVSEDDGAAWRVMDYLEEMRQTDIQIDPGVCHSVLKVLSVHPDHLLRADILEFMRTRWFQLSEDGAHDVVAGLLRSGLFEQALERIEGMRQNSVPVHGWLLDMAVYMLCNIGEIDEAYQIMLVRHDSGEANLSRTLWHTLLDTGSSYRHHASTSLVWSTQVDPGYINPSSGICLNVLTTASKAGDAVLATDVFSHLSKRGTQFQRIHYQLLIECYLASSDDMKRALSILTIMALERIEPSIFETRALFALLRNDSRLTAEAFDTLRELHNQDRKIPIAALNLIIECYVQQRNLSEAMKVYKLIHTFLPPGDSARKSFANTETFNLLLRGCRMNDPPDEQQASFLVSELLALKVKPTSLTYDRLILVFIEAGANALKSAQVASDDAAEQQHVHQQYQRGVQLLDWAYRHFSDMQGIMPEDNRNADDDSVPGWIPRFGTLERLATHLAKVGDVRCWDVLQAGEDHAGEIEGWEAKGKWVRKNVENAWEKAQEGNMALSYSGSDPSPSSTSSQQQVGVAAA
ncbi:hypothetical protein KC365_g9801 [Hortaea werneckii]|nr:hypothetical protein KC342_g12668 [Hortaea werneckii]KAI7075474.1 hypothetical protein KC339_g13950 [Hortaea werneckii]KAI7225760.1 hypothetical protein KC365_g9801 [Hortaea werneckii]